MYVILCYFLFFQVGKGLSKNSKAQKLALQHWLEAVSEPEFDTLNYLTLYLKDIYC